MGRPSDYTEDLAACICELIADGQSLKSICSGPKMPHRVTVYKWLGKNEAFHNMYVRAREEQADTLADEIVSIADESDDAQIGKLRVDARKWVAAKLKPRKYGERITTEHTGSLSLTDLTSDQLDAKIQGLLNAGADAES